MCIPLLKRRTLLGAAVAGAVPAVSPGTTAANPACRPADRLEARRRPTPASTSPARSAPSSSAASTCASSRAMAPTSSAEMIGAGKEYWIGSSSASATAIGRSRELPIRSLAVYYRRTPTVLYFARRGPHRRAARPDRQAGRPGAGQHHGRRVPRHARRQPHRPQPHHGGRGRLELQGAARPQGRRAARLRGDGAGRAAVAGQADRGDAARRLRRAHLQPEPDRQRDGVDLARRASRPRGRSRRPCRKATSSCATSRPRRRRSSASSSPTVSPRYVELSMQIVARQLAAADRQPDPARLGGHAQDPVRARACSTAPSAPRKSRSTTSAFAAKPSAAAPSNHAREPAVAYGSGTARA